MYCISIALHVAALVRPGRAWSGLVAGHLAIAARGPCITSVMAADQTSHSWCHRCVAISTHQKWPMGKPMGKPMDRHVRLVGLQGGCPFGSLDLCLYDSKKPRWSFGRSKRSLDLRHAPRMRKLWKLDVWRHNLATDSVVGCWKPSGIMSFRAEEKMPRSSQGEPQSVEARQAIGLSSQLGASSSHNMEQENGLMFTFRRSHCPDGWQSTSNVLCCIIECSSGDLCLCPLRLAPWGISYLHRRAQSRCKFETPMFDHVLFGESPFLNRGFQAMVIFQEQFHYPIRMQQNHWLFWKKMSCFRADLTTGEICTSLAIGWEDCHRLSNLRHRWKHKMPGHQITRIAALVSCTNLDYGAGAYTTVEYDKCEGYISGQKTTGPRTKCRDSAPRLEICERLNVTWVHWKTIDNIQPLELNQLIRKIGK